MTIAIEPYDKHWNMEGKTLKDKWSVVTADGELSAHHENTLLQMGGNIDQIILNLMNC